MTERRMAVVMLKKFDVATIMGDSVVVMAIDIMSEPGYATIVGLVKGKEGTYRLPLDTKVKVLR